MNMKRTVYAVIGLGLVALLLAGIVWALAGRGGDTTPAAVRSGVTTVDDMRKFKEFSVYWLGESFHGLSLVAVHRMDYPGAFPGKPYNHPWHEVSFDYGDCTIPPGESSCPVPLTVAIRPYCEVPPEVVAQVRTGSLEEIRGAMVQRMGGSQVQVWTSNVSISINTTEEGLLDEAIQNLVRLNGDNASSPEEPLGPPDQIECPPQPWMGTMPGEDAAETTTETMPGEHATETTTECYRNGTPIPCPNVTPSPGVPTPSSP
jgi:hypothetical protein